MALLSLPVSMIAQEGFAIAAFAITLLSAAALSLLLFWLGQAADHTPLPQALVTVALGWTTVAVFGGLPLWLSANFMAASMTSAEVPPTVAVFTDPLNALFEGFSGYTSAGLTMVIQPSNLPVSLQWWRSFMQWVGGVGIIVLAISLLKLTQNQYELYQAEGRQSQLRLTITRTVRRIWIIYTGYTAVSVLLLRILGMTWWESLNHSMSAISTGGFSITDGSMGSYSAPIKLAVIGIMILGAISFNSHDKMISKQQLSAIWRDHQHRLLAILLLIGSVLVAVEHHLTTGQFAWVDSIFQWVSALTTCGFGTQSLQFWSSGNKLLLSLAMVIGGAAGSTVGGIKLSRLLILADTAACRFRRTTLTPRQITIRRINGKPLTPKQANREIEDAVAIALLWIVSIVLGVLILLRLVPLEYTLSDVIFEVSSALGSAGLSTGITGASMHWLGKCVLIVCMWMGRLEIIPVLMLLGAPWSYLLTRVRKLF
ncbi:MAG: TrkH family potassium uptake protein [Phormidesmis sp.]